jgi:prevent-host-death family protein
MTIVSTSQAKNQLSQLIQKTRSGEEVIVERRGQPVAVILSYQNYQDLIALREKARRQKVLMQLRELAQEVQARNQGLTKEEIDQVADDIVREAIDGLMRKGAFLYESE